MVTETATTIFNPKGEVARGRQALTELKKIVQTRPDRLVINGRQYLYYSDWQLLGAFFNITVRVDKTEPIEVEKPTTNGNFTLLETVGFHAWAIASQDGKDISSAEAECLMAEKNWKGKERFAVLSMAQTRACAKALRNCLSWVVRLPTDSGTEIADEVAEEIPPEQLL